MNVNIKKSKRGTNWDIRLTVPIFQKESNCYMEDKDLGDVNNMCGMVADGGYEFGFTKVINMSYAGKADQYTTIFLDCGMFMTKEEFEKLCKKVGLDVVYYHEGILPSEDEQTVEDEIALLVRDITSRDFMVKSDVRRRINKIIEISKKNKNE